VTLWADSKVLEQWRSEERTGKRGRPRFYTQALIECALTLGAVYHLPLRATQGLFASLVQLLGLYIPTPHYSTLCRRRAKMQADLPPPEWTGKPVHLAVDSTGLKVSGEGEWKVRKHGADKRRQWRKVHLAVDTDTGIIHAVQTTGNEIADGTVLPDLLGQVSEPMACVLGDGSYDWRSCYAAIAHCGAKAIIPPRRGAVIWQHGNCHAKPLDRDAALRHIRKHGRAAWKWDGGYHRRSLAETGMFRLKGLFGSGLSAKSEASQAVEVMVRCAALNTMTRLGMPKIHYQ